MFKLFKPFFILNKKAEKKNFHILASIIAEIMIIFLSLFITFAFIDNLYLGLILLLLVGSLSVIVQWLLFGGTRLTYIMTSPFSNIYKNGKEKKENRKKPCNVNNDTTDMQERQEADVGIRYFIEKEKKNKEYYIEFWD